MKKTLLTLTFILSTFVGFSQADYTYHSVENCIVIDTISTTKTETYNLTVNNPNTTNNANAHVTEIIPNDTNATITYALPDGQKLLEGDSFAFSVDLFAEVAAGRFLMRLFNDEVGSAQANRGELIGATTYTGTGWQTASFNDVISAGNMGRAMSAAVVAKGGYNRVVITFNNKSTGDNTEPVYIDNIKFDTDNTFTPLADDTADLATNNQWYHNYSPDAHNTTITSFSGSNTFTDDTTPSTSGNDSATVLKVTREDNNATTGLKFSGNDFQTTYGDNKVTVRVYPVCNTSYGVHTVRIRVRKNNTSSTQIQTSVTDLTPNEWNEVSLDISGGTATDGLYNEVYLLFNQGENLDSGGNPAIFYVDALQVPLVTPTLSANNITSNNVSVSVYPNPVASNFTITANDAIKTVKLYSITGGLVKTFGAQASYSIADVAAGVYFANVETATGSKTIKIIKK